MNKLLTDHLADVKRHHVQHGIPEGESQTLLDKEAAAKRPYCAPSFGQVEVLVVVSAFDDSTVALQEMGKSDFLEPLGWDFLPSPQVLVTVRCVLWLFNIDAGKAPPAALWSGLWAAWIVKNIDTHVGGWEWMTCNEPTGLFTKPYELSIAHLDAAQALLPSTYVVPDSDATWQRMPAYLLLRYWVTAACDYLHMVTHCLPTFPMHTYIAVMTKPPTRTPKENVWFTALTEEGVPYYYHRHLKTIVLERPEDFDGDKVVVPRTIESQMLELLMEDPVLRADVEVRRVQLDMDKDKDNEWVECMDATSGERFYYSFQRVKVAFTRPQSKNIISAENSVAFQCVLRIQAAYRMRQAKMFVREKRQKTRKLPRFTSRNFF
ncbi:Aste57867_25327 [Aphanomyces stellatus]|uniref:Aste57867_25327 protein n=1 Tax=Aphanomyces stellatus TaxID=120398 RepID=A0A485LST3_9STRA|nr:hypothetical protein As57867_025249 [Aphanomyces stellatus]VFU01952.1 Aste57867_25327 [Aphanomyces stellatus]